jgi:hypothetical protein
MAVEVSVPHQASCPAKPSALDPDDFFYLADLLLDLSSKLFALAFGFQIGVFCRFSNFLFNFALQFEKFPFGFVLRALLHGLFLLGSRLVAPVSIHSGFHGDDNFFNGEYQIFSDIHFPSGMQADAHVGGRFANNVARHWDMTLADHDEYNHRFTDPCRIHGRKFLRTIGDHAGEPLILETTSSDARVLVTRLQFKICSNLNTHSKDRAGFAGFFDGDLPTNNVISRNTAKQRRVR